MTRTEYPINTEDLDKGSRISAATIEHGYSVKRGTDEYRLAMLRAKAFIVHRLAERDLFVVAKFDGHDIIILTDNEAAPYTDDEFKRGVRKMGRSLAQQASVNRANLTDDVRTRHDRAMVVNGAGYAAIKSARRKAAIAPKARDRMTPAIGDGTGRK